MATYNRNVNRQQRRAVPARSATTSRISVEEQARQLADSIIAERDAERRVARLGKIYTRFDAVDDVLANNVETVTRGLFSGDVASLTTISKATLTATQERYYYQLNDANGISQLSIAYGNFAGSGSAFTDSSLNNDTPARAIYKQYAQTLLEPNDKKFTLGNNQDTDSIYVLNFNRARIREKLDPGNFEITLRHISASVAGTDGAEISSSNFIQIIDDSSLTAATLGESGQVYNLVSGSLDSGGIFNSADMTYFGLLYPQHGVAILDATQLDKKIHRGGIDLQTNSGNASATTEQYNIRKLYTAISSSNGATDATRTGGIQARSAEAVKSTYYFVRAKNAEFNYSNNPSFVTGSLGQLTFNSFKNDPQVYITSVGLYNDRRELLAVAKLSQPLLKNYTREALIKVKLDF